MKKLFTTIKVSSHGMSQTNHDSKKTTKRLLLSVALTITSLMSLAYDFSSESIYYTITSSSKPYTVAVTKGAGYGSYSGSVTIPVEVTYNGNNYSVTSIATNAFALCSVTTVNLPSSLITIEESAFQNSGLTDISISASVSNINSNAFYNCTKLSTITVDAANTNYCSENGILFNANKTTLVRYPIKKSGNSYPVPSSVTNIGDYAFVRLHWFD